MVTAANEKLEGGGGVDGAIHKAAGYSLLEACQKIGHCATGSAVITPAFDLAAQNVIHAVGPIYRDGHQNEARLLRSAYQSSLNLFLETGHRHLSFPAISTGVYAYPAEEAAEVAWNAVLNWIDDHQSKLLTSKRITFVLYNKPSYDVFTDTLLNLI